LDLFITALPEVLVALEEAVAEVITKAAALMEALEQKDL
jgi:hypothetical protein